MIPGADCVSCALWELQTWIAAADGGRLGQCRAHAPSVVPKEDGRARSAWPLTRADDWCGDHATVEAEAA